jgi:hypothetical protein
VAILSVSVAEQAEIALYVDLEWLYYVPIE